MQTVSDFIVERLLEWGVKRVFGYPGDGINGVMAALDRHSEKMAFVQVRHEEMAAFMACGHAKYTGELGVCIATSGPGAIHLLAGLYDAKMDRQPVLAIVGQQSRLALGSQYQQEVDLTSAFKDVASEFVQMATVPGQVRHLIDRAVRIALDQCCPTCIVLPNDLQEMKYEAPPRTHGAAHSGYGYRRTIAVPEQADLQRAADLLNAGEKVAMLVGAGALGASAEVAAVAERLGAGVAKALLGKAVLADDLPYVTGSLGLLGTKPSWDLMNQCDTLLMVGTSFPYSEFLPPEGSARAVQIDRDGRMLGLRYPTEVNLVGDSGATLRQLLPLLKPRKSNHWQASIESKVRDWWALLEKRANQPAEPINPQKVFWELSARLPENAIIATDSGTSTNWFARDVRLKTTQMASVSGGLASMGCAMPYAIAAKFAHPDRPVIALVGDGAMQMNGINELITLAKYMDQWTDGRFIVLVLNNRDLSEVSWEQRVTEGTRRFVDSQVLPDFPYDRYAESIGLTGMLINDPATLGEQLDAAFQCSRPIVLNVMTDPTVPPTPPHVTIKQMKAFASAMLAGDDQRSAIIRRSIAEMFP